VGRVEVEAGEIKEEQERAPKGRGRKGGKRGRREGEGEGGRKKGKGEGRGT